MRNRAALLFLILIPLSAGLYAKRRAGAPAVPAIPQMTADQKALHALNRLTFGARPGDLEQVKQMGSTAGWTSNCTPKTSPRIRFSKPNFSRSIHSR